MSWAEIYIHLVFSTKYRYPHFKNPSTRNIVFNHIRKNAKSKGIIIYAISGYDDHTHCLLALKRGQTISNIARLIKGESSNWINDNKITNEEFNWQNDYWAQSISPTHFDEVRHYIEKQELHHNSGVNAFKLKSISEMEILQ